MSILTKTEPQDARFAHVGSRPRSLYKTIVIGASVLFVLFALIFLFAIHFISELEEISILEIELEAAVKQYEQRLKSDPSARFPGVGEFGSSHSFEQLPVHIQEIFKGEKFEDAAMVVGERDGLDFALYMRSLENGGRIFVYSEETFDPEFTLGDLQILNLFLVTGGIIFLVAILAIALSAKHITKQLHILDNFVLNESDRNDDQSPHNLPVKSSYKEIDTIIDHLSEARERNREFLKRETEFLTFASHEFRTPIAIVSSNVELLKSRDRTNWEKPPYQRIDKAVNNMKLIAETLLWLGRETKRDIQHSEVLCFQIIEQSVSEQKHVFGELELRCTLDLSDRETKAPIGPYKLIVDNLVRNAFQHADNGTISISLSKGTFCVVNSGIAPLGSETGIGLRLCERIATNMGWQFSVSHTESSFISELVSA